ncbi:hypothetical protein Plec18167_009451 [Paecilomyces lecythidis]|uniref:Uncharacterized protein n=1 Tax=Paecilomyces lecythidis TaxID=3004212 RepID=A0ABR3WP07_9EURO
MEHQTTDCIELNEDDGERVAEAFLPGPAGQHKGDDIHHKHQALRSRWHSQLSIFFRTLGLPIITASINHFLDTIGANREPPKVAINRDRITATHRCAIHILPIVAAIFMVSINLKGYYIGATLDGMGGLQYAAKFDEMLMIASLSVVVLSFIRHELVRRDGIPFGASLAGLQFTNLSYLWSMELWGALTAGRFPVNRKAGFLLGICFAAGLAATVGPSAAILLIPRLDYWPAGNTTMWLNATTDQLWPTTFDVTNTNSHCDIQQMLPISNGCPSSEWQSLLPWITYQPGIADLYPTIIQFTGKSSLRQMQICDWRSASNGRYANCIMAFATGPHSAVADALSLGSSLWYDAITTPRQYERYQSNRAAYQTMQAWQPYSAVGCISDWITQNSTGQLHFMNGSDYSGAAGVDIYVDSPIPLSEFWKEAQNSTQMQLRWVDIPESAFANASIGAVGVFPATSPGSSVHMVSCLIEAKWVPSILNTTTDLNSAGLVTSTTDVSPLTTTYEVQFPVFKAIHFTTAWAKLLNPVISDSPRNHTVIGELLTRGNVTANSTTGSMINGGLVMQTLLASLTTNALSRSAFYASPQGQLKISYNDSSDPVPKYWLDSNYHDAFIIDPSLQTSYTPLQVTSTLLALGYNHETVSVKLSIAVLLVYCIVAISHLVYSLYTGISSSAWDSISEVTALAVGSQPTPSLRGTSAGISRMATFRTPVRIAERLPKGDHSGHSSGDNDQQSQEREWGHLEMVFDEHDSAVALKGNGDSEKTAGNNVKEDDSSGGWTVLVKNKTYM